MDHTAQIPINALDKHILFELERNCRIADVKLAKLVKKSKDAVRYRIKRLEEQKIITSYKTWIDPCKFGYYSETLYLTCKMLPDRKRTLIDEICNDPRTYWIGVAEGVWNIGATFFVKNKQEFYELKQKLLAKYSDIILNTTITSLVSLSVHEKTFFIDKPSKLITFSEQVGDEKLDALSIKMLERLFSDATINVATLAYDLKTTVDKVRQRMQKMEANKIIVKYTAVIDYQRIGYEYYKAFIYLQTTEPKTMSDMYRYFESSPLIINIVKELAPWDLELVIFARSFSEYEQAIAGYTKKFAATLNKIEIATMGTDILYPCKKPLLE